MNNYVLYALLFHVFMPTISLKKRLYFFMAFVLSAPCYAQAQTSVWGGVRNITKAASKKAKDSKHKLQDFKNHLQKWGLDTSFNRAFLLGGKLNTDGWTGCMYFVKRKNNINNVWQVSFSEIKQEKQTKQQGTNKSYPELGNPTPYVYGKINNLYTLQLGFGKEKMLLPGIMEGNLSVSLRYNAGFSLAMLKPYYLKMMNIDYSTNPAKARIIEDQYTLVDSAQFLNEKLILGAGSWSKSLNKIDYVPGAYFETALAITPGKTKTFVQIITLGCNGAIYYKLLPIMQGQKPYPYQINLFAGIGLGKRWK